MLRRRTALSTNHPRPARDLQTTLSQGPTGSAPGTASVYKMRLRADPHRSQITRRKRRATEKQKLVRLIAYCAKRERGLCSLGP